MDVERAKSEDVSLPIGFRFHPTDEELVLHYLKRKVFSLPLPATVIPELDLFHSNPSHLPGELKEKRYFFCKRRYNLLKNRTSDCGYWKASGKEKEIMIPGSNLVIGMKKSFVFYHQGREVKSEWMMHVFGLVGSLNSPSLPRRLMMQVGDWVVCRLYQRKKRGGRMINHLGKSKKSRRNLRKEESSSCCSEITQVSCDEEEATSPSFSF